MNSIVKADMSKSSAKFIQLIAPFVVEWLKKDNISNEIKQVEHVDNEVCKLLDQYCGIDYLHVYHDIGRIYGIASRVQYCKNWKTFTVRYARDSGAETEYKKRVDAIRNGFIYPQITVHAYISNDDKVNGIGMMMTKDLFNYIYRYQEEVEIKRTNDYQYGLSDFIVCKWDLIASHGYRIRTFSRQEE